MMEPYKEKAKKELRRMQRREVILIEIDWLFHEHHDFRCDEGMRKLYEVKECHASEMHRMDGVSV